MYAPSAEMTRSLPPGWMTRSARFPRSERLLSARKPAMIERIMTSAATATKMPAMPIQLVLRARR